MATKAKSISAADLSKLTRVAVKAAMAGLPGKFVGKGPTMGYILQQNLKPAQQMALATKITAGIAASAKTAGIPGLQPKPVVILRPPGRITIGFIAPELGINIQ